MLLLCRALSFILQLLSVKQLYYYFPNLALMIWRKLKNIISYISYTIVVLNGLNLAQYHDITKSN